MSFHFFFFPTHSFKGQNTILFYECILCLTSPLPKDLLVASILFAAVVTNNATMDNLTHWESIFIG